MKITKHSNLWSEKNWTRSLWVIQLELIQKSVMHLAYIALFFVIILFSSCDNSEERTRIQNSIDKEWHARIKVEASSNSDSKAEQLADYGKFRGGFGLAGILMADANFNDRFREIFVKHRMRLDSNGDYDGSWYFDFGYPNSASHKSVFIKEEGEWSLSGRNRLELTATNPYLFHLTEISSFDEAVLDSFKNLSVDRTFFVDNINSSEMAVWTLASNQGVLIKYVIDIEQVEEKY